MTEIVDYSPETIARGAEWLRRAELILFAPGTVYAVMADATQENATARLYELKQRPAINPLMMIVHSVDAARRMAVFDRMAEALAERFWPGPLTLTLPWNGRFALSRHCLGKSRNVAVCVHDAPRANRILAALDRPVASSSANFSGRLSPSATAQIDERIRRGVRMIFDDGPASIGIESTLLMMLPGQPVLVRPGAIPTGEIERVLGRALPRVDEVPEARRLCDQRAIVPNESLPHYGSSLRLRLDADRAVEGEVLLGFGADTSADFNLSESGDLCEAARNLYAVLTRIRAAGHERVAVVPLPEEGLGATLRHRLQNAAASSTSAAIPQPPMRVSPSEAKPR